MPSWIWEVVQKMNEQKRVENFQGYAQANLLRDKTKTYLTGKMNISI